MPEKILSGWPDGTKEIKRPDGKKEIILPEATDMNKFDRARLKTAAAKAGEKKEAKLWREGNIQSSLGEGTMSGGNDGIRAQKKYPVRQEQIRVERNKERKFREDRKENATENYRKIWGKDKISL